MRALPDASAAAATERDAGSASARSLLRRFLPLSLSDVVMTLGDPLQTMALSRLADAREVLAAVGVVKAMAVFLESPVIMILHASTALSGNAASRRALVRFTLCLSGLLVGVFLLLTWRPIYDALLSRVFGVGPAIAATGRIAFLLMVPWPAVIAWRRLQQGLLIRSGRSRQVGWASLGRLAWVALALSVGLLLNTSGALLAGLTLIGAVLVEAIIVTVFARRAKITCSSPPAHAEDPGLPSTIGGVTRFYVPLASTMLIVWGGRATLISLVARAPDGALALAAWPAAWGLVLSIANATRMVQQIVISSAGEATRGPLIRFVLLVGGGCSAVLLLFGFTPSGARLLAGFLGEHGDLVAAALPVVRITALFPLFLAVQNALQGLLIRDGKNWRINTATLAGVGATLLLAFVLVRSGSPGAASAAWAMVVGILIEILVLARGFHRAPRRIGFDGAFIGRL
jgi:hypothetical protein